MIPPIHQFARLFTSHDGKEVLSYLKHLTKERVLPASASDNELRFLEGERFLVHQIETLICQGKKEPQT
ncbi:MAG: hypothetical protein IKV03_04195 [Alphaproteobacteria bacterium]|nr:hypothetical protein [Alphaproteobacteria bacterium]